MHLVYLSRHPGTIHCPQACSFIRASIVDPFRHSIARPVFVRSCCSVLLNVFVSAGAIDHIRFLKGYPGLLRGCCRTDSRSRWTQPLRQRQSPDMAVYSIDDQRTVRRAQLVLAAVPYDESLSLGSSFHWNTVDPNLCRLAGLCGTWRIEDCNAICNLVSQYISTVT